MNNNSCGKSNHGCLSRRPTPASHEQQPQEQGTGLRRRSFMAGTTFAATTVVLGDLFHGRVAAQDATRTATSTTYPRIVIGSLAELKTGQPLIFDYPKEAKHSQCMLVRLKHKAGGGVGPKRSIVAYSTRCTHMGGDLSEGYVTEHSVLGCGEHLTTFDLTRHGMVVAGHATESLPQIILEIDGDDIIATGIIGLLYGYASNPSE